MVPALEASIRFAATLQVVKEVSLAAGALGDAADRASRQLLKLFKGEQDRALH